MDELDSWDRLTSAEQAYVASANARALASLGYQPLREQPPMPNLSTVAYDYVDDAMTTDVTRVRKMFEEAIQQVRRISPSVDLYELGLRDVGESTEPAAAHLARAQQLIRDGSMSIAHVGRALREHNDEPQKMSVLTESWREYIEKEVARREQWARELLSYNAENLHDAPHRRADGEPLTLVQAGTLGSAYAMDVLTMRQSAQLDIHARFVDAVQVELDSMSRTINGAGAFALASVIARMRRARAWALQVRSATLALTSVALVYLGIHVESAATSFAGDTLLVAFGAAMLMWLVADFVAWRGELWIHRHHLSALEQALTQTCSALTTLRQQEYMYNVQRGACGWQSVLLLPRPIVKDA